QRALHVRLRTSATTLVVFGACVAAESITGPVFRAPPLLGRTFAEVSSAFGSRGASGVAQSLADGLGAIALPVTKTAGLASASAAGGPSWQYVLCAALLLAALQPALVAARSAPRLWLWLSIVGGSGILLASWLGSFPAALVACAGLAV